MTFDFPSSRPLSLAIGIDHSPRELIHYLLSAAAKRSTDTVRLWLEEAVKGGLDVKVERVEARFVADGLLSKAKKRPSRGRCSTGSRSWRALQVPLSLAGELRKTLPPGVDTSER